MRRSPAVRSVVDATLEVFIVLALTVLMLDVLWGVFTRYVLEMPSRWTEEVAQYLLMWVALFGAAAAFGRGEHLGFDYLATKMTPPAQRVGQIVCHTVVVLFVAVVMVFGGFRLVANTFAAVQVTPALEINKGLIYLALPLSGCFALFYEGSTLWGLIAQRPGDQASRAPAGPPDSEA